MKNLIQSHKDYLVRSLKGYDSSLRAKGVTLYGIIQDIDKDTSITDEEIKRKFNVFYNKTVLILRRLNQTSKESWLEGNTASILKYLYVYHALSQNIYKVDESLISWYRDSHIEDGTDLKLLHENDLGHFLFVFNEKLYSVEIFDNTTSSRHVNISNIWHPEDSTDNKKYISYSFDYETFPHEEGEMFHHEIDLSVICNNNRCPRWSQSLANPYKDNAKTVLCDLDDCSECKGFKECGVLRPIDALTVVKAIYECVLTREGVKSKRYEEKEYEHIPLPQREDDVVIYFGEPKKAKSFESMGLVSISESSDTGIVNSHASPREHHRRGGVRRAYERKDGVKVRATTFRETTVNKGNTKTTYSLKERK